MTTERTPALGGDGAKRSAQKHPTPTRDEGSREPPEERALTILLDYDGSPADACFPADTMPMMLVSELVQRISDLSDAALSPAQTGGADTYGILLDRARQQIRLGKATGADGGGSSPLNIYVIAEQLLQALDTGTNRGGG